MQGLGTIDSPYLISTPQDLQAIDNNLSAYYELANDIDMTGINFTPLGRSYPFFQAHLDGKGHKISNLRIVENSVQYTAFIARTNGGGIKNVGLENVYIESSKGDIGGLVALNSMGDYITNCYVTGTIKHTSTGKYTGGLVGRNLGLIENCYVDCTVSGYKEVGGITGWTIDFNPTYYIKNCYSNAVVNGNSVIGIFIADIGTKTLFENNFYNSDLGSNAVVEGITGKTTNELQQQSTYTNWDFTNVWYMDGYPKLRVFGVPATLPKSETITVDSFAYPLQSNLSKRIKATKPVESNLSPIYTVNNKQKRTQKVNVTYSLPIHSNVKKYNRTVRNMTVNVDTHIKPIGSFAGRESKSIKVLKGYIKPLQADISVLYPMRDIPVYATVSVIYNPSRASLSENMSRSHYIVNPSNVEVI